MSHTKPQNPKLAKGRPSRVTRTILDSWPLLVWIGVLFLVVWTYRKGVAFRHMDGTVAVYQEAVSPLETGILLEVLVDSGAAVKAGDVVARMDTSLIDKKISSLKAEIAADREDLMRRLREEVRRLESEMRELRLDEAGDVAELAAVEAQIKTLEDLLQRRLIPEELVEEERVKAAALRGRVTLYPELRQEIETALADARKRVDRVESNIDVGAGDEALGNELEILLAERDNMSLRSVIDGEVYRVEKEPGEVVDAGEAVVRIVAKPEKIIALLPQEEVEAVTLGQTVWVASSSDRHKHHPCKVTAISPRITHTPDRASPLPNKMLHGRELSLSLPETGTWLPGQTVIVNVKDPGGIPIIDKLFSFRAPSE